MRGEKPDIPVFCFVGPKNSGKTTLLEKVIRGLREKGIRVAAVKHDAHRFEIDHPGKDSHRFAAAGAEVTVISSPEKLALVLRPETESTLAEIIERHVRDVDVVLAEGYKESPYPRIEVHRGASGKQLLPPSAGELLAVATDEPVTTSARRIDLDDAGAVVSLLLARISPVLSPPR